MHGGLLHKKCFFILKIIAIAVIYVIINSIMIEKYCFVSVEFPDDPNVVGRTYWYLCEFGNVRVGSYVVAPLGRHNHLQQGVVRKIVYATETDAPYPFYIIKRINKISGEENVQDSI